MSSHHCLNPCSGEIVHANCLSEDIGALYLSDDYSDVTLIVNGQRFNAHKVILAARSQYFRALLFGGLRESSQNEIEMKEPSLPAFKGLLKYIYTGLMSLAKQQENVILEILALSHQYGFTELETAISDYLKKILDIRNVCIIFDAARLYHIEFLMKVCYEFMDKHANQLIKHDSFLQLSSMALSDLLARNSFYAEEIDIFSVVQLWIRANPSTETDEILSQIRLSLISVSDLLNVVRPTGLVSPEIILDAIAANTLNSNLNLNHRGLLLIDENVATPRCGAEVLIGEMKSYLLDGDTDNYDMERGYTRHTISNSLDHCILIKLGTQCIINHLKMLLWDRDGRSYSYYVEVSMDNKNWIKVIDHTQYFCRSWQYLYFEPKVVLYFRIVGTNNTVNKRCKEKLNTLAISVMNQWPGVKLRVTEGWDEEGKHAQDSLHYEGRAVDVTTSDRDRAKYGMLARLAVEAGFDWVYYESRSHIHCSVKSESSSAGKSGGCFPGSGQVLRADGRRFRLDELQLGERVAAMDVGSGELVFSEVIAFIDRSPEERRQFVRLSTRLGRAISLTPTHLLLVRGRGAVFAAHVRPGDRLLVRRHDSGSSLGWDEVLEANLILEQGAYAPLTLAGTLLVDDVLASCYALVDSQNLAHAAFLPLRVWSGFQSNLASLRRHLLPGSCSSRQAVITIAATRVAHNTTLQGVHWYASLLYTISTYLLPKNMFYN